LTGLWLLSCCCRAIGRGQDFSHCLQLLHASVLWHSTAPVSPVQAFINCLGRWPLQPIHF
jgi:hypothetical protein